MVLLPGIATQQSTSARNLYGFLMPICEPQPLTSQARLFKQSSAFDNPQQTHNDKVPLRMSTIADNKPSSANNLKRAAVPVFVASTVMLTFISVWRVVAIVLSDLASSAYYVGGDAEKVIGKSAPWFILAVMLFSYAVRAVYIESSSMFVRGGVYRVVKEAMARWRSCRFRHYCSTTS
jgi:hypothetical protein